MVVVGWVLIGAYILFLVFLLAKEEYYDKKEKKRRNDLRAEIRWPVVIHSDHQIFQAETANISAGGALICCEERLTVNNIIRLVIKPPVQTPLEITAEVVRTSIYCTNDFDIPRGMAVRFIIIADKDRQFLSFTVFDHLQEKTPLTDR
jgi:hypothetical protein